MNRTKQSALSLAEVLVTCGLFTLFGLMTLQATIVGLRSQSHVTAANTARRNASAAFSLMRRDFLNCSKAYCVFSPGPPAVAPVLLGTVTLPSKASYADVIYSLVSDGASPPVYKLRRQVDSSNPPATLLGGIEWMNYAIDSDPAVVVFSLKMKDMRETLSCKARFVEISWAL